MAEQTVLFVLLPLDRASPLAWCMVSADSEAEARHAASGQSLLPVITPNAPMSLTPEIPAPNKKPRTRSRLWLTFRA